MYDFDLYIIHTTQTSIGVCGSNLFLPYNTKWFEKQAKKKARNFNFNLVNFTSFLKQSSYMYPTKKSTLFISEPVPL